jgi:polyhydroxyalkanoate synthesis repressor PhaR
MAILIKRYANRKLYNTETSRYITLKGIAELLDGGQEVRVVDNESGEDITSVALSQILVDSERSNTSPPDTLLSQIFGRGGDALYGAFKKSVDDATDGIGDLQDRMRRIVHTDERRDGHDDRHRDESHPKEPARHESDAGRPGLSSWINQASPEFEKLLQTSVERVFKLLDLPRRSDIETLNENLQRVVAAVETLEKAFANRPAQGAAHGTDETTTVE